MTVAWHALRSRMPTSSLLPIGIETVHLSNVTVGDARIDLNFERVQQQVIVSPTRDAQGVQVYVHL